MEQLFRTVEVNKTFPVLEENSGNNLTSLSYETGKIMKKDIIKSLIAIKQSEIPFDVIERDVKLPINRKKIITVPGVRRCGKSTLMEIAINNLIRDGVPSKNILWLGFDDELLTHALFTIQSELQRYLRIFPVEHLYSNV